MKIGMQNLQIGMQNTQIRNWEKIILLKLIPVDETNGLLNCIWKVFIK